MIVTGTELEDFESSLREEGYSRADFELTYNEEQFQEARLGALKGAVTVTNTKRRLSKTYPAGDGTSWPREVHLDLRSGVFGEP